MTISSEVRKAGPYVGNDVSTSFSFAFKVFSSGDVIVVLTNPSEEESILVEGDDYTVTLNDDQDTSPGGSIEKTSALADGYLLTVTSGMENLQPVEITNLGGFYPSVLNSALDRMTILIQQVSEQVGRAVKTPISSGLTPDELLASIVESDSEAAAYAAAAAISANNASGFADDAETSALAAAASAITAAAEVGALAVSSGAALVGFTQSGTGAVAQTVDSKLKQFVSVKDFGAVGDGVADDTAALQAFFNYVTSSGALGIINAGIYLVTSKVTINISGMGFEIKGAGNGSAHIKSATTFSGAGAVLQLVGNGSPTGWRIGGFSVSPVTQGMGAAAIGVQIGDESTVAINILGYQFSTFYDVQSYGYATLYKVVHSRMIRFMDCSGWNNSYPTANTCLELTQNGAATSDLLFDRCQFVSSNAAGNSCVSIYSDVGPYNIGNGFCSISGLKFRSCDFYAGEKSIKLYASAASWITNIWFVDGCQIDQQTVYGVYVESKNASTLIEDLHFDGMFVQQSTNTQIAFTSTGTFGNVRSVWVEGCSLFGATGASISTFGSATADFHVNNNSIIDCAAAGAAIVFNGTAGVSCSGNKVRKGVLAANPYYVVALHSGASQIYVSGNDGQGVVSVATVLDNTGDVVKTIVNNPGFNPRPLTAITVTASPFVYKNTSGSPELVHINGGTVSLMDISGNAVTPAANMALTIPHGKYVQVTYTVAPTMLKQGV